MPKRTRPYYDSIIHIQLPPSEGDAIICGAAVDRLHFRIGVERDFNGVGTRDWSDINAANKAGIPHCRECVNRFREDHNGILVATTHAAQAQGARDTAMSDKPDTVQSLQHALSFAIDQTSAHARAYRETAAERDRLLAAIVLADELLAAVGEPHEWDFDRLSDGCECGLGISHPVHSSAACRYAALRSNAAAATGGTS
ncbi:MAG: hypothetical protein IID41_09005 [Planctomycetes bacterium]|nr:hypothetical protein [Planctomycetota bacterium]